MLYVFLAVVWLSSGDPPQANAQAFPTEAACNDFRAKFGVSLNSVDGITAAIGTCLPVSNPTTAKAP